MSEMNEVEVAPQREFKTLDDFISGQNNFWHYFIEYSDLGILHREKIKAYSRFKKQNFDYAVELMRKTTNLYRERQQLPWKDLYQTYQLMSKLVCKSDNHVKREDGSFNDYILCM